MNSKLCIESMVNPNTKLTSFISNYSNFIKCHLSLFYSATNWLFYIIRLLHSVKSEPECQGLNTSWLS